MRAKKIDKNQGGIVSALRKLPNVTVALDHDDIFVGYNGMNYWFELKAPEAVSKRTGQILESAKKPSQIRLQKGWCGQYGIVSTYAEIVELIGYPRSKV